MRIASTFGLNQVVSHGFGVFLFAALIPMMRESIAISYWHLALIGALTQIAYLTGALLLSLIGHRISSGVIALSTGMFTSGLLLTMAILDDPVWVMLVLTLCAASASVSWGALVELISRYASAAGRSTCLSTAASGTAWGYGMNGLVILMVVPVLGWRSSWILAGIVGCLSVFLTWRLLKGLRQQSPLSESMVPVPESATTQGAGLNARMLWQTVTRDRAAFFACLICCLVGLATMPFSSWLNIYLEEQGAVSSLGGYTWTIAGITGMFAGYLAGKVADAWGHGLALIIVFSGFAIGVLAFIFDPLRFAPLAGVGYGLMYFPMWGIIAGWLSRNYSAVATMQINSIGMVVFGIGGAAGNLLAGWFQEYSGSLSGIYLVIAVDSLILLLIAIYIVLTENRYNSLTADLN